MHSNMALHPIAYTILYIVQSPIEKENMGDMESSQKWSKIKSERDVKRGSVKKAFMYSVFLSIGSKCIDKVRV